MSLLIIVFLCEQYCCFDDGVCVFVHCSGECYDLAKKIKEAAEQLQFVRQHHLALEIVSVFILCAKHVVELMITPPCFIKNDPLLNCP